MKALSIRQPWAWLIVQGYKNLENRTWKLPEAMVGQRIVVHAGLTMGWGPGGDWIQERLTEKERALFLEAVNAGLMYKGLGALVGEADILGPYAPPLSPLFGDTARWFLGPHAFVLNKMKPYAEPVPCKGRLGFFELTPSVLAGGRP